MDKQIPLYKMYSQRENFVIVALTGITGSGCSAFADMMANDFSQWNKDELIRPYNVIADIDAENKQQEVFKREYLRCYQVSSHYKPFQIIRYKNILILYMLIDLLDRYQDWNLVVDHICQLMKYKFHHSHKKKELHDYEVNSIFTADEIRGYGLTNHLEEVLQQLVALKNVCKLKEQQGLDNKERTTTENYFVMYSLIQILRISVKNYIMSLNDAIIIPKISLYIGWQRQSVPQVIQKKKLLTLKKVTIANMCLMLLS